MVESALQEFFNFLLLNNSALVRSLDNILRCTLSDQPNPLDKRRGKHALILYHWSGNVASLRDWPADGTALSAAVMSHTGDVHLRAFYELMVINVGDDSVVFYWGNKENSQTRGRMK